MSYASGVRCCFVKFDKVFVDKKAWLGYKELNLYYHHYYYFIYTEIEIQNEKVVIQPKPWVNFWISLKNLLHC